MKRLSKRLRRSIKAGVQAAHEQWVDLRYSEPLSQPLSEGIKGATAAMRGNHPPAVLIHGVMPRSGTNYVGDLLSLHPDVEAYVNQVWEMPLLATVPAVQALQQQFIQGYRRNHERFDENDFLALIGESFIAYLHTFVSEDMRLVMKVPLATHLSQFDLMFPHELCLMILRDGRDVVASTLMSWPGRDFAQVAAEWRDAASYMMRLNQPRYRYEDFFHDPSVTIRELCDRFGMDADRFPYEKIQTQPVRGSSQTLQSSGWRTAERPSDFRPVGRWRDWSHRTKERFKRIAGDALVETGYEAGYNW